MRSRFNAIRSAAVLMLVIVSAVTSSPSVHGADRSLPKHAIQQFGKDGRARWFGSSERGCFAVAFSPDGKQVATGHSRDARRWDVATGKLLATYPNPRGTVHAVRFSPDGKHLAYGAYGNSFALIDLATDQKVAEPNVGICVGFFVDYSADGSRMVSDLGGGKGARWDEVGLWDTATQRLLRRFRVTGSAWRAAITPDGSKVVIGDSKGFVTTWDAGSGKQISRRSVGGWVQDLKLSSDGRRVFALSGHPDNALVIADLDPRKPSRRIQLDKVGRAVAVSPDGRFVATAGNEKGIQLFDTASGKQVGRLAGHKGGVSSLTFSPDGKSLLSGGFRGKALLWDVSRVLKNEE